MKNTQSNPNNFQKTKVTYAIKPNHSMPEQSCIGARLRPDYNQGPETRMVIKPRIGMNNIPREIIREIVVRNNLQVNDVHVSTLGNTIIRCPNMETRDKLKQLLLETNINKS